MSYLPGAWTPFPVEPSNVNQVVNNRALRLSDPYQFKYMGISSHVDSEGTQFVETAIILYNGRTFSHNNYRAYNGLVFCPYKLDNVDPLILPPAEEGRIIFVNNIGSAFLQHESLDKLPSRLLLTDEGERGKFLSVTQIHFKGVRAAELVPIQVRKLITEEKACPYCEKAGYKPVDCAFWLAAKLRIFMRNYEQA